MPKQKQRATLSDAEFFHPDVVEKVSSRMPEEEHLLNLAELFKVFGDSTRVRIMAALSVHELCVNDLASLLNMTPSAISHQLKALRNAKLARARKDGKEVFYSLDDEHVNAILAIGMQHVSED